MYTFILISLTRYIQDRQSNIFITNSSRPVDLHKHLHIKQKINVSKYKQEHHIQFQSLSIILLKKKLVKKGHNSKTIAFRVMSLVLQLHLVIICKYSKFDIDSFNTF